MTQSFNPINLKRLAQIIFEWRIADRTFLLTTFAFIEVSLQWAWCLFIILNQYKLEAFINVELLDWLWSWVSLMVLIFGWMTIYFNRIRLKSGDLISWQIALVTIYTLHVFVITVFIGYSGLFAGVSMVGASVLGMLLLNKRVVFTSFIFDLIFILAISFLPYIGFVLPSVREFPLDFLYQENHIEHLLKSKQHVYTLDQNNYATLANTHYCPDTMSATELKTAQNNVFFWRLSYFYFSLPKAVIIVYMVYIILTFIEKNHRNIQYNAEHDTLTGLKNRRSMLDWIHHSLFEQGFNRTILDEEYSLILIDIDFFKKINDSYGHNKGDEVLQEVAELLTQALLREHAISRYGGEEFLIALPVTDHDTAITIAEALRQEIETHHIALSESDNLLITASFGVASIDSVDLYKLRNDYKAMLKEEKIKTLRSSLLTESILKDFIQTADLALYEAKNRGRNQVTSANELIFSKQIPKPVYAL